MWVMTSWKSGQPLLGAHLTFWQIILSTSDSVHSPRRAGRGLGRGALEERTSSPPKQNNRWDAPPAVLPSPPQVCGGEGDRRSYQKVKCAREPPSSAISLEESRSTCGGGVLW